MLGSLVNCIIASHTLYNTRIYGLMPMQTGKFEDVRIMFINSSDMKYPCGVESCLDEFRLHGWWWSQQLTWFRHDGFTFEMPFRNMFSFLFRYFRRVGLFIYKKPVGVYCDICFVLCWVISLKPGVPYKSISALIHVETHICVTYSSVSFIIPGETLKSGSGQDESIMLYLSFAYL